MRSAVLMVLITGSLMGPRLSPASGPASLGERIDRAVAPWVEAGDFQGVVAAQQDGSEAIVRTYGLASVELRSPHRPDGIFRIGSISKQFTAALILKLEEEGRLATSDRLSRHLPRFPHADRVTLEQLLTHTAGVGDVYSVPRSARSDGRELTLAELVEELGRLPLTHEPGSTFAYSNGGYALLAAVSERAGGAPFGELLETRLLAPLGLDQTAHDEPGPAVTGRVPGYDPWGATGLTPVVTPPGSFAIGSGSLWSSARDLLTWSHALHTGGLLAPASYAKLTRDYGRGYGYGISVFRRFGRRVAGHDGRIAGYSGDLARYLDDGWSVAVLSNVQSVARDQVRRAVAAAIFDETPPAAAARELGPTAGNGTALEGRYGFGPSLTVTIARRGGRLMARANEGGWSELLPLREGGWFSRTLYTVVRFERDPQGRVEALLWGDGDGAPRGPRLP